MPVTNEFQVSNSGGRNRVRIIITTANPHSLLWNCSSSDIVPKIMCHLHLDVCPLRWNGLQIQARKCHRCLSQMKVQRYQSGCLCRATCFCRSSYPSCKENLLKTIWTFYAISSQPGSFPQLSCRKCTCLTISSLHFTVGHSVPFVNEQQAVLTLPCRTPEVNSVGMHMRHSYLYRQWLITTSL